MKQLEAEVFGQQDVHFTALRNVRSAQDMGSLQDAIHQCVRSAFERPDFDKRDTLDHIKSDYLILAMSESEVMGFSSLVFGSPRELLSHEVLPDVPGCYFAAAAVAKEAQGRNFYQKMNEKRVDVALKRHKQVIFTRTQNPLVETSITHTIEQSKSRQEINGYSLERILLPGCYGGMLTGEPPPRSSDRKIQAEHDKLDLASGDAFVLLYSLSYYEKS